MTQQALPVVDGFEPADEVDPRELGSGTLHPFGSELSPGHSQHGVVPEGDIGRIVVENLLHQLSGVRVDREIGSGGGHDRSLERLAREIDH